MLESKEGTVLVKKLSKSYLTQLSFSGDVFFGGGGGTGSRVVLFPKEKVLFFYYEILS